MAIVELPRADDDADPLVPKLDEMLRRKPTRLFVVDDRRAKSIITAPGENDGNVGRFEQLPGGGRTFRADQHQTVHPAREQRANRLGFGGRAVIMRRDKELVSLPRQRGP